jgi:hypothetical protein
VKKDVVIAVKNLFASGVMPSGVNETVIILLPKKDEPEELKDFRPISLGNVVYKVVSKCLVNRLRPLLQDVICPTQSVFIPGRLIMDNALIAFECLHALSHGNNSCKKFGALKFDLTKVYDRVEWVYIEEVLDWLGFHRKWVRWIMECITTVWYSVHFNNVSLESFEPTRRLHQGDPLSPYLFLFVADGLSNLLQNEINHGHLQELHICRRASGISHLLFANDTLLFMHASDEQVRVIRRVLANYERSTGQLINPAKSSMMLGSGCTDQGKEQVFQMLNVSCTIVEEKYLGLPTPYGHMSKGKFKSSKECLVKRLSHWSGRLMSSGAKEVLIKSVAQAILIYVMGVFKLLDTMCEDITQLIRKIWWGEEGGQRKVHWISWEKLLLPKNQGGMGFRDMKLFNKALLAHQAWHLIQSPESICARLLKAKYFPNGELVDSVFSADSSHTWKAVVHWLDLVKQGIIWRIGSGSNVNIWRDPWICRASSRKISLKKGCGLMRWVSQLMVPSRCEWNEQTLHECMYPHAVVEVLKVRLSERVQADHIAWFYEKSGIFIVISAFHLAVRIEKGMGRGLVVGPEQMVQDHCIQTSGRPRSQ